MKKQFKFIKVFLCVIVSFYLMSLNAHCDVPATISLYTGNTQDFDTGIVDCRGLTTNAGAVAYYASTPMSPIRVYVIDGVVGTPGGYTSRTGYFTTYPYISEQSLLDSGLQPFMRYRWSLSDQLLYIYEYTYNPLEVPGEPSVVTPTHTHDFVTGTIYEATCEHDGLEGTYCKTCGFIKESSPISAYEYTLETYAGQKITAAKSGQKIILEFKELNSFPKAFMEKIAARVAEGVSFEFRYNVNHELQKITIPAYSTVDTSLDWYGYAKMAELYGMN